MSLGRLAAIAFIYALACAGWILLGGVTAQRNGHADEQLAERIHQLWGPPLTQDAPVVRTLTDEGQSDVLPETARIRVHLDLLHRRKGLIWYPTYTCQFTGSWTIGNPTALPRGTTFHLPLPDPQGTYDDFQILIDGGESRALVNPADGVLETMAVPAEGTTTITVRYTTRGLATWRYRPGSHLGRVRGLDLEVTSTDPRIDFPDGSLSPTTPPTRDGTCTWSAGELISRKDIAVEMPERLNPGPLAARITYFAPVCLGFFFLVIGAITVVSHIPIHPMHYLFIAGGFFAFHILLVYLVDVISIHVAFPIASAATLILVTGYLRAALGSTFPAAAAATAQAFFLVLFSYSFFLDGITGLTVAIGSVITLAILMRLTARIDWNGVFASPAPGWKPRSGDNLVEDNPSSSEP